MLSRPICIVALTNTGKALADKLLVFMPHARILYKPKPFAEQVKAAFLSGDALLLICATGIAVRTLAPVLANKHEDPPVLIADEHGRYIIPLLSGHQGGANNWAKKLSSKMNAQAVITTADSYLSPIYTVGMGCERNCPESVLFDLLEHCLDLAHITLSDVQAITSIDIKANEVGLIKLSKRLSKPFVTYTPRDLSVVDNLLSSRSDYVFSITGVYGVAESAALVSAQRVTGEPAELALIKHKNAKATCAIARSYPKGTSNNYH